MKRTSWATVLVLFTFWPFAPFFDGRKQYRYSNGQDRSELTSEFFSRTFKIPSPEWGVGGWAKTPRKLTLEAPAKDKEKGKTSAAPYDTSKGIVTPTC
ncbi:hypothetical protein HOY80DRAFT_965272 [Tuber brumale]|nr:hypothetical protein HOY80DRAFT_965272 [Tuber brumale]